MKTFVTVLKSIFTSFSAVAFLFIGLLASFCSAAIEWYVLKEILSVPGWNISAGDWAGLVILILEGTKFVLHFYNEAFKRQDLNETITEFYVKKKRRIIVAVKNGLTIFSLICSMICVTNILYHNNQAKIESYVQEKNAECDRILNEKISQLEEKRKTREDECIARYDDEKKEIKQQRKILKRLQEQISEEVYSVRRQDLQEEADAMRAQIRKMRKEYAAHIQEAQQRVKEEYDQERASIETVYGPNGSARASDTDVEAVQEGDNPYLRTFLLAITQTFFGTGYSREAYFLCTLFISLVVAAALEYCIMISQSLLTMKSGSFMAIIGEMPRVEGGKKAVCFGVWLLTSVFLSTAIYFIASIILQSEPGTKEVLLAMFTYAGTTLLFNAFMPRQKTNLLADMSKKNKRTEYAYHIIEKVIIDAFVPAAVAFVVYFLLGFLIDGANHFGDMAGFAIAIGGTAAKAIRFDQCDFLI